MKNRPILLSLILMLCSALSSCGFVMPEAELHVRVRDQNGNTVSGAEVGAFFPHIYGAGASVKGENIKVITDREGYALLRGRIAGTVGGGVELSGYYRTQFEAVDFPGMHHRGEFLKAEREAILKEIHNPIPMYARPLRELKLPGLNAPFGFDLEVGDWVAPHGEGKTADIIFEIKGRNESYREHDLTLEISFPNEGDGLVEFEGVRNIGSQLRSEHLAPENGYRSSLSLSKKALYDQKSSQWLNESKPGSNYYLRIRTVLDEDGKVISANYGKIYGNFEFLNFIKAEAYYFNPTPNDRNIEFDTQQNLANPPTAREQVRLP